MNEKPRNPGNEKPLSLHPLTPEEALAGLMQTNPKETRMNWTADMMCPLCTYTDTNRSLDDMTREEALQATLDCPSCETKEAQLEVIEATLTEDKVR